MWNTKCSDGSTHKNFPKGIPESTPGLHQKILLIIYILKTEMFAKPPFILTWNK